MTTQDLPPGTVHHPSLYRSRRYGTWCVCTCTWQSRHYTTTSGAHLEYGQHLLATRHTHAPA